MKKIIMFLDYVCMLTIMHSTFIIKYRIPPLFAERDLPLPMLIHILIPWGLVVSIFVIIVGFLLIKKATVVKSIIAFVVLLFWQFILGLGLLVSNLVLR